MAICWQLSRPLPTLKFKEKKQCKMWNIYFLGIMITTKMIMNLNQWQQLQNQQQQQQLQQQQLQLLLLLLLQLQRVNHTGKMCCDAAKHS